MRIRTNVFAIAFVASAATTSMAGISTFNFQLSGDQEVPPITTDTSGEATLTYDSSTQLFDIDISVVNLSLDDLLGVGPNSTPIHIHSAPSGSNGGIAIDIGNLFSFVETDDGLSFGGADIPIGDLEDELFNAGLYVNIHTNDFPSGELRGQIIPAPASAALLGVAGLGAVRRRR